MHDGTLVNVMMEFKDGRVLVNFLLLSLWPFLVLINDLDVDNLANVWNYVDETTVSEVVTKGNRSCAQEIAHKVAEWSTQNRVQLNSEKCKELRISFVKDESQLASVVVDGNELERVSSV